MGNQLSSYQFTPYSGVLFLSTLVGLGIAFVAWRRRSAAGALYLALLQLAAAEWACAIAFEVAATTVSLKWLWSAIAYPGTTLVPLFYFLFAISYSQYGRHVTPRRIALLAIIPVLTVGMAATNNWHHWLWSDIAINPETHLAVYSHGVWFWIFIGYSYALLAAGVISLCLALLHFPAFRAQIRVLLVGSALPIAGNVMYVFELNPIPGLDWTPFAFVLSGLVLAWGIFWVRILDLVPVARAQLVDRMSDGVMVCDRQGRIVDLNPAMQTILGLAAGHVVGRPAAQVMAHWSKALELCQIDTETHTETPLGEGEGERVYDLQLLPLCDRRDRLTGRLVVLRDITDRKQTEEALRENEQALVLLTDVTRAALEVPDLQNTLQVLADRLSEPFHADGCYITLWDQARQRAIPAAASGAQREIYPLVRPEPGELTLTESALRAGHALVIENVLDTPYGSRRISAMFPTRSLLALPLIAGDQKLGAALIAYNTPHSFTANEVARGEHAAGLIALAVAKAKLLEEAQVRWREAETLRQALGAVNEILSLDERLERILEQLARVVPYDSASVQLLRDGGCLEIVGGRGFADPEAVVGMTFPVPGDNPNTLVVERREPVILPDAQEVHPPFRQPPHDHIRSWLGVPLIVGDRLIGLLAVDSVKLDYFDEEHLRLVIPFADQVAVAIENSQLYEEMAQLKIFNESIVEGVAEAILVADAQGLLTFANPAAEELLGYSRQELIGMHWTALVPEGVRKRASQEEGMRPRGMGTRTESAVLNNEGREIPVIVSSRSLFEEGQFAGVLTALVDITETRQAEQALRESEDRYRRLVELLPDGVAVHQNGVICMANLAGARMLGYDSVEELIGRPMIEFVHPDDRDLVLERAKAELERGEIVPPIEERFMHRDGTVVPVEVAAGPYILGEGPAALVVIRDISARKRLEEQLRQAQMMEAVGRLAGGVAHDFNNLLMAIIGYTEFILEAADADDPVHRDAEAVLQAAGRAARLTQQLLAFGRRQVLELKVIDLNRLLEGLEETLRRLIGEEIEVSLILDPGLGNVRVDSSQMEQVVINLAVNAREAMPEGGRLVVETNTADLDEAYARQHAGVRPGRYVQLSVSDTGRGMSPEVQQHLFEPFFTTKDGGTGLGLATVYGIVNQFEGHIQVASDVEKGTRFKIYLPQVQGAPQPSSIVPAIAESAKGAETVLVVEDNEMVRSMVVRALSEQGYTVLEARRGSEALQVAGEHAGPIDLLLTDVVTPGMSGQALAQELQQFLPGLRVLYTSGYSSDVVSQHGILEADVAFIGKPFSPHALAQKVRGVLDRGTET